MKIPKIKFELPPTWSFAPLSNGMGHCFGKRKDHTAAPGGAASPIPPMGRLGRGWVLGVGKKTPTYKWHRFL